MSCGAASEPGPRRRICLPCGGGLDRSRFSVCRIAELYLAERRIGPTRRGSTTSGRVATLRLSAARRGRKQILLVLVLLLVLDCPLPITRTRTTTRTKDWRGLRHSNCRASFPFCRHVSCPILRPC